MAKIPEVGILSFWNLTNNKLPEHALSGQIIIVQESQDMYVGTGDTTPIIKITDLSTVTTIEDLKEKNDGASILYIVSNTNEIYFFYNNTLQKCNTIGIIGIYDRYSDLPVVNEIDGLFCVNNDETNNNNPTVYAYTVGSGTYVRLHYSNFNSNTIYRVKINNKYISANKSNNHLNIITDNTLYTSIDNNILSINKKMEMPSILKRKQRSLISGIKEPFPESLEIPYSVMLNDEMYIIGFTVKGRFVNKIYKYNLNIGWELLAENIIPVKSYTSDFYTVTYNNKIYIYGGKEYHKALNSMYEFDPVKISFTKMPDSLSGRYRGACTVIDNKLWLLGGLTFINNNRYASDVRDVDYYDFELGEWVRLDSKHNTPIGLDTNDIYFTIGDEIHLIRPSIGDHYIFNTNTFTYSIKNKLPHINMWQPGVVKTTYNIVYCFTKQGIYTYNPFTDIWGEYVNIMTYNKYTYNICIDSNDVIYNIGDYSVSDYSKELELLQAVKVDISNNSQIVIRTPINKKIQYAGKLYKSVTVEKNKFIEYLACKGDTVLDLILRSIN